jgi:short-subunit dehydrogenase
VTLVYPGPVDTNLVRDGRAADETQKAEETDFLARRAVPVGGGAARVVRGIERNAARVVVGTDYRLIDLAVRLAPSWAAALLARFAARRVSGK